MNIHNTQFVVSAVSASQYPKQDMPEIALAGRSNVGKSSFINKMLNRKGLARVSSRPGKTAQINFYNIDGKLHIVDLPGYGYAEVSKAEKARWGRMIEEYLGRRAQLKQTVIILDSRHKPTADDVQMCEWIKARHGRLVAVATKTDKLNKSKITENLKIISDTLGLSDSDLLLPFSAETGEGRERIWSEICKIANIDQLKGVTAP